MIAVTASRADLQVANVLVALFWGSVVCALLVWPWWPWDTTGRPKKKDKPRR